MHLTRLLPASVHTQTHAPHSKLLWHTDTHALNFYPLQSQVRAFPFDKFPPHVKDLGNYAFKALVLREALLLHKVVLWIDAGLELRAPLHTTEVMLGWLKCGSLFPCALKV